MGPLSVNKKQEEFDNVKNQDLWSIKPLCFFTRLNIMQYENKNNSVQSNVELPSTETNSY
jgi:hypothetical protein